MGWDGMEWDGMGWMDGRTDGRTDRRNGGYVEHLKIGILTQGSKVDSYFQ